MTADAKPWDARLYDDKHAFVWKHGAPLVELLEPKPGERIVDLGCGTGHLTAKLAAAGAEVIGIDQDPAMIDEARRNYPGLQFEIADAREFFVPEPVDAVFSNAVLHWVRPPEAAVRRIHAALKPGGRMVVEFGGKGNVGRLIESVKRQLNRFAGEAAVDAVPNWYYPSIAAYTDLLEASGLEPISAVLFDRMTRLEGVEGLRNWISMFVGAGVESIAEERRDEFFATIEEELRADLYRDGAWYADYRRLRVVAKRNA